MTGRRVSIRDVAREAGVSVTTVSHALNGKGRLSQSTRSRVQEVAERLGYRPDPAARSLVSGRTRLLAAMASLPEEPRVEFSDFGYYTELIGAATGEAVARDYALVVAPPTRAGFVWDRVPLDGVIVIDPVVGEPALPVLRRRGIPFVTVGRAPEGHEQDAVVASDDMAATKAVLDHMAAAGAERIALVAIPPIVASARDAAAAYQAWCSDRGQQPVSIHPPLDDLVYRPQDTVAQVLEQILSSPDRPDAIYAPIERLGVTVLHAAAARGLRIPHDLMLATTHDAGLAAAADPPLTTLEWDHKAFGHKATSMLLDLIEGRRRPPCEELVDSWIATRASTAR